MTFDEGLEQRICAIVNSAGTRRLTGRELSEIETMLFFLRRAKANKGPTAEEELKALGYGRGPAERVEPLPVHVMSVPGVPPRVPPGVPEPADL